MCDMPDYIPGQIRKDCPDCGDDLAHGYFDYALTELGPDCVRAAYCFDCQWALYESGRIEHGPDYIQQLSR